MGKGWKKDPYRHSLAGKGIKSSSMVNVEFKGEFDKYQFYPVKNLYGIVEEDGRLIFPTSISGFMASESGDYQPMEDQKVGDDFGSLLKAKYKVVGKSDTSRQIITTVEIDGMEADVWVTYGGPYWVSFDKDEGWTPEKIRKLAKDMGWG